MARIWSEAIAPRLEGDIEGVEWDQVADFPTLVAEIKAVPSPVFCSKFCHFLAPRIFPVIDNAAMGTPFPTYKAYFTTGRRAWLSTPTTTREALVARLTKEVRAGDRRLFAGFPMKCKLIELCLIGKHQLAHNSVESTPRRRD